MKRLATTLSLALLSACGGSTPPPIPATPIPVAPVTVATPGPTGPDLSNVPPAGTAKDFTPAHVAAVPNKLHIETIAITDHALPIAHVRVAFFAGSAAAAQLRKGAPSQAGLAEITAKLLQDGGAGRWSGREIAEKIDALGTELSVDVGIDRVVLGLSVTRDKLDAAMELLGALTTKPRFDQAELTKLTARELDRVAQAQKSNGTWMARMALYRTMFGAAHPYAEPDATPTTIARIHRDDVVGFWKKAYVARNGVLTVAGDVEPADVASLVEKHFSGMTEGAAIDASYPSLPKRAGRTVLLVPKVSAQADVLVAVPALARKDAHWPELALGLQALGGGMTSRLFLDVREKRSLAYSTSANARELAVGPSMVVLYAGTQTKLAPEGVRALIEDGDVFASSAPISDEELSIGKQALDLSFVYRLETIGAVASLAIDKRVLGLPGADVYGYVSGFREALRAVSRSGVESTMKSVWKADDMVIAVAGDAALAEPLTHFGAVTIVDASKDFAVVKTMPANASASLEVPGAK